jgi:phage/plasmid primase-like uncharacterized protein
MGGPWSPKAEPRVDPPEVQLRDAITASGLTPPATITLDGKLHRFKSGTKGAPGHGDKPGWYIAFGDGIPAGRFGCWRSGLESSWRADVGRAFSPAEEMAHTRRMAEAKATRDAELIRTRELAANNVDLIYSQAIAAAPEHPYLARKGIQPHGARITGDGRLIVPLFNCDGELTSLQYISDDGGKQYHPGGATSGCFTIIGTLDEPGRIYIAEGFATAATIHETTGRPCVVAFSANNLVPVCETIRSQFGADQDLVIVADNDVSGVGQKYANQASAKYGARVIVPPTPGDANDYKQAGEDLAALLEPALDDWLIPADEFCKQPSPITWLVKGWLQAQALIMVHGPSGGGKTFAVLDWCLRMSSGIELWADLKVRPSHVVYLAGEGHHGLRGRVAAWKHYHGAGKLNMWLSKDGCDLNTVEGFRRVVDTVSALPSVPSLIVVDTLHRFLLGDENSAQDAKTMLDACNALMNKFNCAVLLVHHTGVSDEAQHRARGSSAWRGALDIEISIIPGKPGSPMQIVQRKSKDAEMAEPIYCELRSIAIPGWFDEDGEQVTSAVVEIADAPAPAPKKDTKQQGYMKTLERAWWAAGGEEREGRPYVSRAAVRTLLEKDGLADKTIRNKMEPSRDTGIIHPLLNSGQIDPFEHGWIITDNLIAAALLLRKNGG